MTRQHAALFVLPGGPDATSAPADGPSDAELAAWLQDERPQASWLAWTRFAPLVHGALARALGTDDDVPDLVQEVFFRLFRRVHTLRDRAALRSFVYSIVVRVLRSELRRRRVRRIMRPLEALTGADEPAIPGPADDGREALRRFYGILDRLSARERAAYVLRHVEGLSLDETAVAVGVSLATIKRCLARAAAIVDPALRADDVLAGYTGVKEGST